MLLRYTPAIISRWSCFPHVIKSSACVFTLYYPVYEECASAPFKSSMTSHICKEKTFYYSWTVICSVYSPASWLCAQCWQINTCFCISLYPSLHTITEDQTSTMSTTDPFQKIVVDFHWVLLSSAPVSTTISTTTTTTPSLTVAASPMAKPLPYST